jgi:hypothetical protein
MMIRNDYRRLEAMFRAARDISHRPGKYSPPTAALREWAIQAGAMCSASHTINSSRDISLEATASTIPS